MKTKSTVLLLTVLLVFVMALTSCEFISQFHEHVWEGGSCTEPRVCSVCKAVDDAPLGHTEETVVGKAATCTEAGLTDGTVCSVCDATIVAQETIPALGHDIVADAAVDATCTESGLTAGEHCTRCDGATVAQETVPALGHDIVVDAAVGATCIESGLTEGSHCSRCDNATTAQEIVPATGHSPAEAIRENVVNATCGADGSYDSVVKCSSCGTELSREKITVPSTGEHVYATETEKVDATCIEDGYVIKSCGCGDTEKTTLPATGHTEETVAGKDATCIEAGLTEGKKCTVCGETLVAQEEIPANGHSNGADGITCTVCGKVNYDLASGNQETVIADPGKWYYSCSKTYEFASNPAYYDGVITMSFNYMTAASENPVYQVRYQPVLPDGVTEYTITFTIELTAEAKVYWGADSNVYKTLEAGIYTYEWTGTLSESKSFCINVRATNHEDPITMKVSNVAVTYEEPNTEPETPSDSYVLSSGNADTTIANPGTWYYYFNKGTEGENYAFAEDGAPTYTEGTITTTFSKVPDVGGGYYFFLRYQPTDDQVGADGQYKITLTITLSAGTQLRIGTSSEDYGYKTIAADTPKTYTFTMTKGSEADFTIRIHKAIDAETFTMTVKIDSIEPVN